MKSVDINCDMGEGMPDDAELMPWISSANIACGYHAGNEETMRKTILLALKHNVAIGAHPGFSDKDNFGRTEMHLTIDQLYELVSKQIDILKKICDDAGTRLHHVKPHGALYNMAAKNAVIAGAIAKAIYDFDSTLILYGLSGSYMISEAKKRGLKTSSEVFADRTYQDDGSLTPRSHPNALITDKRQSVQEVLQIIQHQKVTSLSGKQIEIIAETICIHGDGEYAVEFAKTIYTELQKNHIAIKAIS